AAVNGTHAQAPASEIVFASLRDIVALPLTRGKVLCPFHDDHQPSCHIYHDHYHCYVCGANGDAVSWLMEVEGLTYSEAVETLETSTPRANPPDDDQRTLKNARALWQQAVPITGTLAEHYLSGRDIVVAGLPGDALRFHPRCPFGGATHPCMLALFRD